MGKTRQYLTALLVCLSVTAQVARAQCLTVSERLHHLDSVSSLPNNVQTTALLAFARQCERCGQATDSLYARALHRMGVMAFVKADYPLAVRYTQQAIRVNGLPRPDVNRAFRVKSSYNVARALQAGGLLKQAKEAFQTTIRLGAETPLYQDLVADAYGSLAHLFWAEADYQRAVDLADQGALLAIRINQPDKRAFNLNAKATALRDLGQYDQADKTLREVLSLFKKTAPLTVDVANTYSDLADLRQRQGRYDEARHYYKQALAQHRFIKNDYGQAEVLANIGYLENHYLHNNPRALALYQQALPLMQQPAGKARILNNVGVVYWQQHRYADALNMYQRALTTLSVLRPTQQNPSAGVIQLSSYKEYLLTLIHDKADTWLDYANATHNRNYLHHALTTYRVADQMVDYMRWEHVGQESKLFWRTKTRNLYERAIETCWRLGDVASAFHFFEKSRAVLLADNLNELGARQQLTPQHTVREQALRESVGSQQRMLAAEPPGPRHDSLRATLLSEQEKQNAFRKQIEISNPAYFRYKYDTTAIQVADLKVRLSDQKSQFVSYFVGDSALYILSISASHDTLIRQPLGAYKQTVRTYMTLLANPDAMNQASGMRQFLTLGNSLYQQLLAPLRLPGGRIIVSPDGPFVPFEALSRSATRADYAVTRQAFSYAYSAGLLLKKRPDAGAAKQIGPASFLGVAPVQFAPVLKQVSLPGSDEALKAIASCFNAPVLLIHEQASRSDFLSHTNQAQVVHLFTHATASDSAGTEPRLYFADLVLNLSDLNESLLQTELVVLAACKTGVGSNERGEGVFSLARGFAALGVPSVVTTLWNVENQATYAITTDFYRYLADGLPKDEALQQAKLKWLTTADGASQLPNYWAGLIVVGNTEPLSHATPWPWLAGGLGIVLLGAGGIWWWHNSRRAIPAISSFRPA